ncbi:hypothetical protein N9915_00500 [Akkermansiaceae bacterium]|nr:hypothetical protein [Akkermansiaceae bacterium]
MKLIMESWRGYLNESAPQVADEKTDLLFDKQITAMLEKAGLLEEGPQWDKIKAFARRKGIPIATALALLGAPVAGVKAGQSLASKHNTEIAAQQAEEDAAAQQARDDRFGADFGELPAEYSDLSNDESTRLAWSKYDNRTPIAAPVSGLLTVLSGGNIENRPFMAYEISPSDVLPLNRLTAEDYRAQVQAQLEDDGPQGVVYLRNQLFGDTGKWLSGSGNEMFRMVDGNPVLPPSWSVAYDVYATAVVERVAQIRNIASISPENTLEVARRFNLESADELEAFLQHELWKVGAGTPSNDIE